MRHKSKMTKQWSSEIKNIVLNGSKHYSGILTQKQLDTLTEWMVSSITQEDVGKKLGVCQTTVHKSIFGNIDYKRNERYGGIMNKIRKWNSGNYTIGNSGYLRKK